MFVIESLPYTCDLIEHYQALCHLPGFALLESSNHVYGRYDVISAYPYGKLTIPYGTMDHAEAYKLLQQMLPQRVSIGDLPFQGGALGFFGYDFGAESMGISRPKADGLNDMPLLDMCFYDWAIVVDHHLKKVHLFNANSRPETTGVVNEAKILWQQAKKKDNSLNIKHKFTALMSKDEYKKAFNDIHSDIEQGRIYQVNLSQQFSAEYEGDSWEIFKRVRKSNPVPFSAFIRGDWGDVISFSPERFLLFDNGEALTSPIKGTIKRSDNYRLDRELQNKLQQCPKKSC